MDGAFRCGQTLCPASPLPVNNRSFKKEKVEVTHFTFLRARTTRAQLQSPIDLSDQKWETARDCHENAAGWALNPQALERLFIFAITSPTVRLAGSLCARSVGWPVGHTYGLLPLPPSLPLLLPFLFPYSFLMDFHLPSARPRPPSFPLASERVFSPDGAAPFSEIEINRTETPRRPPTQQRQ